MFGGKIKAQEGPLRQLQKNQQDLAFKKVNGEPRLQDVKKEGILSRSLALGQGYGKDLIKNKTQIQITTKHIKA